jgi:hypothetical protein
MTRLLASNHLASGAERYYLSPRGLYEPAPGPAYTIDSGSGIACPADATEHAAFETANPTSTMGAPDLLWAVQEASGAVADTSGNSRTGTVTGGSYQQAQSGWSRFFMTFADSAGGIGTTSVPTASSNSMTVICFAEVTSVAAVNRGLLLYGTANQTQVRFTATPRVNLRIAGNTATGTNAFTGAVRPFVLRYDRVNSASQAMTNQEKLTATWLATTTGSSFQIGNAPNPVMRIGYAIAWFSSKTEAQIKAWLQAAGWSIPW